MRVVVTGATGNIGLALVEALGNDAEITSITGVARRATHVEVPKTAWRTADVATDDLGPLFHGADAVVHLAWLFHPTRHPVQTWKANVLGTLRVLDAAADAGVRTMVVASSVGAYSPARGDEPVDESWPTHALPTAAYGRQKSYVERVLDGFEARHPEMRVVRMRTGFVFQQRSASEQRRIFAGPLVPSWAVRTPVLPLPRSLRLQAVHARDAAEAYRRVLLVPVRGPFNVAAEPVIDGPMVASLLHARYVPVPDALSARALAVAWHLRLAPSEPGLLELALSLPVMSTKRARDELGWTPSVSATEALHEMIEGIAHTSGAATPPLDPHAGGPLRWQEFATGVGARDHLARLASRSTNGSNGHSNGNGEGGSST
jgi:nucleoside-diphosphate-sugar epimerase